MPWHSCVWGWGNLVCLPTCATKPLEAIKKGGDKVQANYSSMEGFLAARVFTEGLRQAQASGKITRESFITGTESSGNQVISGFPVSFSATSHAASKFVEMSMLTGDGRVRT